ncbi:MAG TPA: glycosyltransferase, partial [bacterium]|nr:glycosyltransferase [bacterium]
ALIRELGLNDLVKMPGYIQYNQLPTYYGLAKVFILPSTTEQWGLVVNEAMAAGLPVLVSEKCGCAPDLVKNGVNGFQFDPYDQEKLSDLMIRISGQKAKLNAMGKQSQRIVSEWSPENFGKSIKRAGEYAFKTNHLDFNYLDKILIKLLIYCPNFIYRSSE